MTTLKNSKPMQGMSLHKWIATGGKPKDRINAALNAVVRPKK